MLGTLCWNFETWSEIGLASSRPIPVSTASSAIITASTASPRGKRARRSRATNGFSSSAISPPIMNSSSDPAGGRAST